MTVSQKHIHPHEACAFQTPRSVGKSCELHDVLGWKQPPRNPPAMASNMHSPPIQPRHATTSVELNRLGQQSMHSVSQSNTSKNARPKANGTWQSTACWGKLAKLNAEQETVFHILCATFLLTFCGEAEIIQDRDNSHFNNQRECLRKLSRQTNHPSSPLRMFVSAPPGSGKSEFHILCQFERM